jgi:DNA-directed RNA polymerase alpha subunit
MEIENKEDIQIEVLSLDSDHIKFLIKNIETSYANSLRRIMISEVPTMAIEYVYIS